MLYYSKKSKHKIVHKYGCSCLNKMSPQNQKTFSSFSEARASGYHFCKNCSPMIKKYRNEATEFNSICEENRYTVRVGRASIDIVSEVDSWKICLTDNSKTILYHKNFYYSENDKSPIKGYHNQNCSYNKLIGYLDYIKSHDEYRIEHPKTINGEYKNKSGFRNDLKKHRSVKQRKRANELRNLFLLFDLLNEEKLTG